MKYLKKYEVFDLENWDEVDDDGSFLTWLKINYPKDKWDNIIRIDCFSKNLTDLDGLKSLKNLKYLYCHNNQLTELNGLENLRNLKILSCFNNKFSLSEKYRIKKYCRENDIFLNI
jgi:Leucine-rich repeat (LRR) protein